VFVRTFCAASCLQVLTGVLQYTLLIHLQELIFLFETLLVSCFHPLPRNSMSCYQNKRMRNLFKQADCMRLVFFTVYLTDTHVIFASLGSWVRYGRLLYYCDSTKGGIKTEENWSSIALHLQAIQIFAAKLLALSMSRVRVSDSLRFSLHLSSVPVHHSHSPCH
jgi:hypothetical protein